MKELEGYPDIQARIREAVSILSDHHVARLDRRAVLAVAAGAQLGLEERDLVGLRLRVYGLDDENYPPSPCEEGLHEVVARFDALVWPNGAPGLSEEEALRQIAGSASNAAVHAAIEALRTVQPLIQPIAAECDV